MEEKNIKAIIGLGNPGHQHRRNRHNIGFRVLDALAEQHQASWSEKPLMHVATIQLNNKKVLLVKPQTFMNSSGQVISFLQKKGIEAEDIMVVHDELEKKFGSIAVRQGGSHRGHNGLRSIIGSCGQDFWRIRFGIGRPENKDDVSDYVLSNFTEESAEIDRLIGETLKIIEEQ
jgi:PTH1 family peptidyl-tRNA hydrolase